MSIRTRVQLASSGAGAQFHACREMWMMLAFIFSFKGRATIIWNRSREFLG